MNTIDLSSNAYRVDSNSEISYKEIDEDKYEPLKGHVMSKEEFMACVRRDYAKKQERKKMETRKEMDKKKALEADSKSYIIEKMIYQRKKRRY